MSGDEWKPVFTYEEIGPRWFGPEWDALDVLLAAGMVLGGLAALGLVMVMALVAVSL